MVLNPIEKYASRLLDYMVDSIIWTAVNQRHKLWKLAQEHMSKNELDELDIRVQTGEVFDVGCPAIQQTLLIKEFQYPEASASSQ